MEVLGLLKANIICKKYLFCRIILKAIFQSVLGSVEHKTLQAGDLRSVYLERMAVRQDRLRKLAEMADWSFFCDDGTRNPKKVVSNLHFLLSKV